jgi:hypothetical protein
MLWGHSLVVAKKKSDRVIVGKMPHPVNDSIRIDDVGSVEQS